MVGVCAWLVGGCAFDSHDQLSIWNQKIKMSIFIKANSAAHF